MLPTFSNNDYVITRHTSRLKKDDVVVVLLHDSGSRYVAKIYNDDWMEANGFRLD